MRKKRRNQWLKQRYVVLAFLHTLTLTHPHTFTPSHPHTLILLHTLPLSHTPPPLHIPHPHTPLTPSHPFFTRSSGWAGWRGCQPLWWTPAQVSPTLLSPPSTLFVPTSCWSCSSQTPSRYDLELHTVPPVRITVSLFVYCCCIGYI